MRANRSIPPKVKCMLWGRAAGRCEVDACNRPVSYHSRTKETANLAELAHIIGFSADGPRGEHKLSAALSQDVGNLMLLCGECHKLIDDNKDDYPTDRLRAMKASHERRIETVTGITEDRQSNILMYGGNVGDHASPPTYRKAAVAMLPEWYPAETTPINLGMVNSCHRDCDPEFWRIQSQQLHSMVAQHVRPRLMTQSIGHFSVFAIAPQPLLILLGYLLSDIPDADVYQLHREPNGWKWRDSSPAVNYSISEPTTTSGPPALVLSLSATIAESRVAAVLGSDAAIWRMTISEPHNDFLQSRQQLRDFRVAARRLMDRIKSRHGSAQCLHVFPAAPVAIAVEFGRIIMPKADLPLRIYDENRHIGGFVQALDVPPPNEE